MIKNTFYAGSPIELFWLIKITLLALSFCHYRLLNGLEAPSSGSKYSTKHIIDNNLLYVHLRKWDSNTIPIIRHKMLSHCYLFRFYKLITCKCKTISFNLNVRRREQSNFLVIRYSKVNIFIVNLQFEHFLCHKNDVQFSYTHIIIV